MLVLDRKPEFWARWVAGSGEGQQKEGRQGQMDRALILAGGGHRGLEAKVGDLPVTRLF